jgi:ATP-dependent Clp protease ATP-binding subunit ClpA
VSTYRRTTTYGDWVFERFTDKARRVVVLAQEEARMLNHNYIGTEHLLLGLLREEDGVAARSIQAFNLSLEQVRGEILAIIGTGDSAPSGHIPFTPRAKKVLELSLREAIQLGHNYIGTEHILMGLIREGEGVASQVLRKLGAEPNRVRQTVIQLLSGYAGPVPAQPSEPAGLEFEEHRGSEGLDEQPCCVRCSAPLAETLAVRDLVTESDGGTVSVRVAYCRRCGAGLGVVPGDQPETGTSAGTSSTAPSP